MRLTYVVIVLSLTACYQKPHVITGKDNSLGIQCPEGGWCNRNTEVCRPATSDWPRGYCATVADDGRAFLSSDGGPSPGRPQRDSPPTQ